MYRTALVSSRLLHLRLRIPEYRGSISPHCVSVKSVGYGLRVSLTFFMLLLCHFCLMKTSSKRNQILIMSPLYAGICFFTMQRHNFLMRTQHSHFSRHGTKMAENWESTTPNLPLLRGYKDTHSTLWLFVFQNMRNIPSARINHCWHILIFNHRIIFIHHAVFKIKFY